MSDLVIPPIGFERTYKGQVYRVIDTFERDRANGTVATIIVWVSECVECADSFTFSTPARSNKFAPNRRCQVHKRPGCRVKGGA